MIFHELPVDGARRIELEPIGDERGFLARTWCGETFAREGLVGQLAQASLIYTARRGTLRGLHFQAAPHEEAKLVRCIRGAAYVVIVDLRVDSPTYLRWTGVELTPDNRQALYVPPGCAQGYQTLADDTEMFYQMSVAYIPGAARGVRYDDPAFAIRWPLDVTVTSDRDAVWADYQSAGDSVQHSVATASTS